MKMFVELLPSRHGRPRLNHCGQLFNNRAPAFEKAELLMLLAICTIAMHDVAHIFRTLRMVRECDHCC